MTSTNVDELLSAWDDAAREILQRSLVAAGSPGRLSAADAASLARGTAIDALIPRLLPLARAYSHPPISNFRVGAVAVGASGAIYAGANLEVPGHPLNQAVHAEQSAIANAYSNRERGITAIGTSAAPCGHCRQFINEIAGAARIRIVVAGQPARSLGDLLPASFGPADLGIAGGMFGHAPEPLRLASSDDDAAARAALEAAARSYAPYSKSPSGCALRTRGGKVFSGSYLENAAFNPSLSPLQSALVGAVVARDDFASIEEVVLVEARKAAISQRAPTEAVMGALAPRARLRVLFSEQA